MAHQHDPLRCPRCQSARTRSMRMVAMAGTRFGNARGCRATIGARGWWSLSGSNVQWTSQTALAKRYAPTSPIGNRLLLALIIVGGVTNGMAGSFVGLLLGVAPAAWLTRDPPEGFVCLRCGCEFG